MKTAAIYARVSSDKQREENTIASQTAALVAFASEQPIEFVFEMEGTPCLPLLSHADALSPAASQQPA